jgi:membrane carboxypeptidase/penicillin-binding protein PbpC
VISGIGFEFQKYSEDIKYPHFVFYVREFLEQKYGSEILEKGRLKIYTSIDPVLQDKAEEIVEKYAAQNEARFAAQNAALISLDNETGEILAMVGGRDYFDEENKGNVNIITSNLQPGSTFKPFVYSMAIDKEIIGTKTPIYDVKTSFPG